ncbi:MAG: hypothetical protein U0670_13790 [Anaerolineae bacterium]
MIKNRVKFWIFAVGLLMMIPAALFGFAALSSFIAAFNTGADPASIFRGHSLYIPTPEQAQWINTEPEGNAPTEIELEELIAAYWQAWDALSQAYRTGDLSDLPTYWAGSALDHARNAAANETTITYSGHRLTLEFFSDDSSIAVIRDEGFAYSLIDKSGTFELTATAECVLTLDSGFWRIRQYTVNFS